MLRKGQGRVISFKDIEVVRVARATKDIVKDKRKRSRKRKSDLGKPEPEQEPELELEPEMVRATKKSAQVLQRQS
jgi:hypothetical protein